MNRPTIRRWRYEMSAAAFALALATTAVLVVGADPVRATAQDGDRATRGPVDMVLVNGKITTLNDRNRTVSAIALDDGLIVRTGRTPRSDRWPARAPRS